MGGKIQIVKESDFYVLLIYDTPNYQQPRLRIYVSYIKDSTESEALKKAREKAKEYIKGFNLPLEEKL